jgi:hypothetical protein
VQAGKQQRFVREQPQLGAVKQHGRPAVVQVVLQQRRGRGGGRRQPQQALPVAGDDDLVGVCVLGGGCVGGA